MSGWLGKLFGPASPPVAPTPAPEAAVPLSSATVSYFRLQGTQDEFFSLPETGERLVRAKTLDPARAAVAILPDAHPHLCLIAAPDGRRLSIAGDTMRGIVVSARIVRSTRRGIVRLKQPLGGNRFLTAVESAPDGPPPAPLGDLHFDGPGTSMEAAVNLVPLAASAVSSGVAAIGARFGAITAEGLCEPAMTARLRARTLPAELAEALLRLLPRDELSDLARRLLDDPLLLTLLRALLPEDAWLQTHLPNLVAWRLARTKIAEDGQGECPATDEPMLLPSVNITAPPLGHALLTLARTHVPARRGFCLLASARNEGPYLLDWLSYHLSIGFEHVFLYTNDNEDGSDALLGLLARHGLITLVRNARGSAVGVQEKAYAHALTLLPQTLDYRWTAVLDLDEYFVFDTGMFDGIADFAALHEAQPVDAIAMCWLLFASRFGDPYREGLTAERFAWRERDVNAHVKSLFRTRLFWHSQPHFPYSTLEGMFAYRTPDGGFHHHPGVTDRIPAFAATPVAEQAWINHYLFRTAPEALWKLARGSAAWTAGQDQAGRLQLIEFIAKNFLELAKPANQVEDRRIQACAAGQAATLETLLELPGVADAHGKIMYDFKARLRRLAADFLAQPTAGASSAVLRFREAVAASQGIRQTAPVMLRTGSRMV